VYRAERQRQASKRYREKKKVLTDQLQQELAALAAEKQKVEMERSEAFETIKRLQAENEALKADNLKITGKVGSVWGAS
jgi:hypothetical protein